MRRSSSRPGLDRVGARARAAVRSCGSRFRGDAGRPSWSSSRRAAARHPGSPAGSDAYSAIRSASSNSFSSSSPESGSSPRRRSRSAWSSSVRAGTCRRMGFSLRFGACRLTTPGSSCCRVVAGRGLPARRGRRRSRAWAQRVGFLAPRRCALASSPVSARPDRSAPDLAEELELRDELLMTCREVLLSVGSREAAALVAHIDALLDLHDEMSPGSRP